jgi:hypothetical protein
MWKNVCEFVIDITKLVRLSVILLLRRRVVVFKGGLQMKFREVRNYLIGMLLGAFLAACQVAPMPATPKVASPTPEASEPAIPTVGTQDQTTEATSPSPDIIETPTLEPQPTEVVATPRSELTATDPGGVTLASGKPTLVEFFAFW